MSKIDDLINQMDPKRNPEDLKHKNTESKYNIKEKEMNYYAILGVSENESILQIKRAYQKKLKKFHPDKVEQTKENKIKYKLIREAGAILTDIHKKKAYDAEKETTKINNNNNIKAQKKAFEEFIKLQEQGITEENKNLAKLNFEKYMFDFDRKHGYNEKSADAIPTEEYNRKVEDLKFQRDQEELDVDHENMFEGKEFNRNIFNKMFEKKKKLNDKRREGLNGMVKYNGDISAFNDVEDGCGGVPLDKYDSLYSDGQYEDHNDRYAAVGSGIIDICENDDNVSVDSVDDNEYDAHNVGASKEEIENAMKKMMAERGNQNDDFAHMTDGKFGSAIDDKFGISNQLGFMVGDNLFGHQRINKSKLKEDTLKAYKELTLDTENDK